MRELLLSASLSTLLILSIMFVADALRLSPLAVVGLAACASLLYAMVHATFRRRLERDADGYAARVIGIEPVVGALAKLSPSAPSGVLSLHESLTVRTARVRALALP